MSLTEYILINVVGISALIAGVPQGVILFVLGQGIAVWAKLTGQWRTR